MTKLFNFICFVLLLLWTVFASIVTIALLFADKTPLNLYDNSFPAEIISIEKAEEGFRYKMESDRFIFFFKSTDVYEVGTTFDLEKQ